MRSRSSAVSFGTSERAKAGPPALLEDRLLQALDMAVRGRSAGVDPPLLDGAPPEPLAEVARANSEALSVITATRQLAAASSLATRSTTSGSARRADLRREEWSSAQAKPEATAIAVLPHRPLRAREAAEVEAVEPDHLPRAPRLDMALPLGLSMPPSSVTAAGALPGRRPWRPRGTRP